METIDPTGKNRRTRATERKATFEPGDLFRSFTGHFGLVFSRMTFKDIRGKVKQGQK